MRSFDLTEQIERLTASGIGRIQRIQDDVYRKIWPKTVEMPAAHEGRFDRALIVDAFPLYPMHTAVDRGGRRVTVPTRLMPLPGSGKPSMLAFGRDDEDRLMPHGELIRYVIFWQAGQRWRSASPNAARNRFAVDERGLALNEALHLPLQEEALVRSRRLAVVDRVTERGEVDFLRWEGSMPTVEESFGMYAEIEGVPSRAKDVVAVSTEDRELFLKD